MTRIGMHTIFVARENVLFLAEWIDHHMGLGVEKFYLYDNSNSIGRSGSTRTTNKYGINFAELTAGMTDAEVEASVCDIVAARAPQCELIPWQPKDEKGNVFYGQALAFEDATGCDRS